VQRDPSAIAAPWFGKFRAALETIKGGRRRYLSGDKIDVGAPLWWTRAHKIIAALKSAVGAASPLAR